MTRLLALLCLVNTVYAQKQLLFQNATYEDNIRTVMLAPRNAGTVRNMLPAVTSIRQQTLVLDFDDIQEGRNNYFASLVHCTFKWEKSGLKDLDFMSAYNEFNINDFEFSPTGYLPYIHYTFSLPPVKLPGNYLLMVYRDGDKSDLVLTMRFMIFDNRVGVSTNNDFAGSNSLNVSNQQLNFIVNYSGIQVFNPMENFVAVIRQNQRWDNARFDVKPSFIRDDLSQLEYRFFDEDKQWSAGNEFRFVDFRSLNSPGQNTATIDKMKKPLELYVRKDLTREGLAYAQYRDLNGGYKIENLDFRGTGGQYLFVNFSLSSPPVPGATVYVMGQFNSWVKGQENKMVYNKSTSAYEASLILKQGWYDYQYVVDAPKLPGYHFEGSHFQTENFYEVLIYHRSLQPMADLLVGYYGIPVNPR